IFGRAAGGAFPIRPSAALAWPLSGIGNERPGPAKVEGASASRALVVNFAMLISYRYSEGYHAPLWSFHFGGAGQSQGGNLLWSTSPARGPSSVGVSAPISVNSTPAYSNSRISSR